MLFYSFHWGFCAVWPRNKDDAQTVAHISVDRVMTEFQGGSTDKLTLNRKGKLQLSYFCLISFCLLERLREMLVRGTVIFLTYN